MKKLKNLLSFKVLFFFFIFLYVFVTTQILSFSSVYHGNETIFEGVITSFFMDGNLLKIEIQADEKLSGNYYFSSLDEKSNFSEYLALGKKVKITGKLEIPSNNTHPNLFNYKKYLYHNYQFFILSIEKIEFVKSKISFVNKIKNVLYNQIEKSSASAGYLKAFLLGDTADIKEEIQVYRTLGVSHLFAISGMHLGLFVIIFRKVLFFLSDNKKEIIILLFVVLYLVIVDFLPSACRAASFYIVSYLNRRYSWNFSSLFVFGISISLLLLWQPFWIYHVGFQYSATISYFLFLFQNRLKNLSYLKTLFCISLISFVTSFPITLYYFYEVNLLSILYNVLFVPVVSSFLFPLSFIVYLFPVLDSMYSYFIFLMEEFAIMLSSFPGQMILGKPTLLFVFVYYLFLMLASRNYHYFVLLFSFSFFYFCLFFVIPKYYFVMIDVGQGDSFLFHSNGKTILIDTGGKIKYSLEEWKQKKYTSTLTDNILLPLLKSFGIGKIDVLLLTHGDYDHMGEAVNLVNHFNVGKVIFNNGEYNTLELELITVLNAKNIEYYQNIKQLNIGNTQWYFLNDNFYNNENDNSIVLYVEFKGVKFLLMGDAGVDVEEAIIKKYNLKNIDILKVGHHGSKTSSSAKFIDSIYPKCSMISVGKNNRYSHPSIEVLNNLMKSKVYRTDVDGSVSLKIKNNSFKIETYIP